ncbi:hypothetical protein A7K91_13205 [Paenibacillus oryzae]|uniref:Sporulation protein n=1 Tax=Paenibacillus oryzae TaxID=1844972 RepID=A0A1A5YFU0_9BACL|nr:putative sporulation protein YtxC [Paenibacillus oryzae]OBR64447.1 hypothetical protein A7K91_13205 [Paenibacillus oryzae]
MELFSIILPETCAGSADKLGALLTEHLIADLHKTAGSRSKEQREMPVYFESSEEVRVNCKAVMARFHLRTHGPVIFQSAASAIAEFVVAEMENEMLRSFITRKFPDTRHGEDRRILDYCNELMQGKEWDGLGGKFKEADQARRRDKIEQEIREYLHEGITLNLEGFATFRLSAYRKELAEIVEYAMDEYAMDKQYQEFISLLKYFVQMQDEKVAHVHVLHKGGQEFVMYDSRFKPIEAKPSPDRIVAEMLETEMNMEDMVVSTLISVAPGQITIHTRQPELQVIRTLQTIFEGRVKLCVKCPSCAESLDVLR